MWATCADSATVAIHCGIAGGKQAQIPKVGIVCSLSRARSQTPSLSRLHYFFLWYLSDAGTLLDALHHVGIHVEGRPY